MREEGRSVGCLMKEEAKSVKGKEKGWGVGKRKEDRMIKNL